MFKFLSPQMEYSNMKKLLEMAGVQFCKKKLTIVDWLNFLVSGQERKKKFD